MDHKNKHDPLGKAHALLTVLLQGLPDGWQYTSHLADSGTRYTYRLLCGPKRFNRRLSSNSAMVRLEGTGGNAFQAVREAIGKPKRCDPEAVKRYLRELWSNSLSIWG